MRTREGKENQKNRKVTLLREKDNKATKEEEEHERGEKILIKGGHREKREGKK